jgi:two-component system nitrogen regulation sensor histidine kinase NtrY
LSLRAKFVAYLVAIHIPFAVLAVVALPENRLLLPLFEVFFVASLVFGVVLVRRAFSAIDRVRDGARFIAEGDFTARFREVGHPEADALIHVYNEMADTLRQERVRSQEQHFFLEKLLAASPFGVLIFDYDGRITAANPGAERLLQTKAGDLVGKRLGEVDGGAGAEIASLAPGESRVVLLNGARRVKCERAEFLDRGFARSFVLLAELTDELRRSEKAAYEKLIRMMSHEVNNTVAAATSILHSCLTFRERLPGEEREDFVTGLEAVINRSEQLSAFMRSFAEVVRIPDPKPAPCDLGAVVEHVLALMRAEADRRRIAVALESAPDLPAIEADRIQIEQVFVNVVKNALEAMGDGGTLTVRLERRGAAAVAVVEDTGPGISDETRARLFTPFFTTKENGQGIGLTVVQEILSRHGFDFSLECAPGGPTRFTIVFG